MSASLLWVRLVVFVCLAGSYSSHALGAKPVDPEASREIYSSIHERLDPGGDLMVIANVDGLLESALDAVQQVAKLGPAVPVGQADSTEMLAKIGQFLKANGFYAVKGLGMSIVPRTDGKNTIKTFVARDQAAVRLPLWMGLVGGTPTAMKCHAYLPKDTVLLRSGTAHLNAVWDLVKSGITEIGGEEAAAGFNMALGMISAQAGVSADALIGSIAAEGFVSIQLSSSETTSLPIDGSTSLTIPAPSMLLVTAVKDSTIIDTIKRAFQQNLQMPLPEVSLGEATVYNVPIPIPVPFPLQITLATHGNYLLIGSTSAVVTEAINAATTGGGLKSVPEFANAFPSAGPNNGIQFVSQRLGQTLKQVRDQMLRQMPVDGEDRAALDFFRQWMDENLDTTAAFTIYNMRSGVLVSGVSASGGQQMMGAMFAAPVGLMAGIAIPSFVKARETAQHNACINNLRIIDSAKEQWAMMENKNDGDAVDRAGIAAFIKGNEIPVCPQGGTYTTGAIGEDPTCSIPGHSLR